MQSWFVLSLFLSSGGKHVNSLHEWWYCCLLQPRYTTSSTVCQNRGASSRPPVCQHKVRKEKQVKVVQEIETMKNVEWSPRQDETRQGDRFNRYIWRKLVLYTWQSDRFNRYIWRSKQMLSALPLEFRRNLTMFYHPFLMIRMEHIWWQSFWERMIFEARLTIDGYMVCKF